MTCRWGAVLAAAASLAGCGGSASTPPTRVLPPARDTVITPYAEVTRAVWLGGDRWAVVAPNDGVVGLVDLGTGSVSRLGGDQSNTRRTTLRTTLRNPATIFTAEDTLHVGDWGLRQLTLWTTDGRLVRSIPATTIIRGALPQARDAADHFYVELAPRAGADGAGNRDSAVVVRTGATLDRGDTVARLAPLDVAEVLGEQGRRFERRVFSGTDKWGVLPDGSVWVARVYHNRVDWRAPDGTWRKGRALPDRVLEVTRYDRELFIRKFPPELRATAQRLPVAPVKPPFEDAFADANGDVWLVKSRAPADSAGRYHVVGRQGQLLRDLRIPGQGRAVGAGQDAVLVVEPSPKGVRLLRFVVPPLARERSGES